MAESIWDIIGRARDLASSGPGLESAIAALRSEAGHPQYFPAGAVAEAKYLFDAGKSADALALLDRVEERNPAYPGLWNLQITECRGSGRYLPSCRQAVARFQQRGYISEYWLFMVFCEAVFAALPAGDAVDGIEPRAPLNAGHMANVSAAVDFLRGVRGECLSRATPAQAAGKPWAFAAAGGTRCTQIDGDTLVLNTAKLTIGNPELWDASLAKTFVRALQMHTGRPVFAKLPRSAKADMESGDRSAVWDLLSRAAISASANPVRELAEKAVDEPPAAKASRQRTRASGPMDTPAAPEKSQDTGGKKPPGGPSKVGKTKAPKKRGR